MPQIIFIQADGAQYEVDAKVGESVMRAAVDNGIDGIIAECGGSCSCATCHAYVDPAWLGKIPAAGEFEQGTLEGVMEPEDNSRLTCQIEVTPDMDGIIFRIPKRQL